MKREIAAFEAGIKLGALYHQFIGTPISLDTIDILEKAIEKSIGLQPYVHEIKVAINKEMVKNKQNSYFGYCELEGKMLNIELKILLDDIVVVAQLFYDSEKDYPLMKIKEIVKI